MGGACIVEGGHHFVRLFLCPVFVMVLVWLFKQTRALYKMATRLLCVMCSFLVLPRRQGWHDKKEKSPRHHTSSWQDPIRDLRVHTLRQNGTNLCGAVELETSAD